MRTQRARTDTYLSLRAVLSELINENRLEGNVIQLIVGTQPIDGYNFSKGAYGFHSDEIDELSPGSTLALERAEEWVSADYQRLEGKTPVGMYSPMETFVGGYDATIPIAILAKTLAEGGQLSVVEKSPRPTE